MRSAKLGSLPKPLRERLPLALLFLGVLLPLLVRRQLHELGLEGPRERDDDGAGIVLVHVLLDLGQPAKERER